MALQQASHAIGSNVEILLYGSEPFVLVVYLLVLFVVCNHLSD